jgi:hypothetical protein
MTVWLTRCANQPVILRAVAGSTHEQMSPSSG